MTSKSLIDRLNVRAMPCDHRLRAARRSAGHLQPRGAFRASVGYEGFGLPGRSHSLHTGADRPGRCAVEVAGAPEEVPEHCGRHRGRRRAAPPPTRRREELSRRGLQRAAMFSWERAGAADDGRLSVCCGAVCLRVPTRRRHRRLTWRPTFSLWPGVFPAVRSVALARGEAVCAARRVVCGCVHSRTRIFRTAVRRDARLVGGGVGPRPRRAPPRIAVIYEDSFNHFEQDVPVAHARRRRSR